MAGREERRRVANFILILAALMLAIPFFLPITVSSVVTSSILGFFYGLSPGIHLDLSPDDDDVRGTSDDVRGASKCDIRRLKSAALVSMIKTSTMNKSKW